MKFGNRIIASKIIVQKKNPKQQDSKRKVVFLLKQINKTLEKFLIIILSVSLKYVYRIFGNIRLMSLRKKVMNMTDFESSFAMYAMEIEILISDINW